LELPSTAKLVVALCGRAMESEKDLAPLTDFGERLPICPFGFSPDMAYYTPQVFVLKDGQIINQGGALGVIGGAAIRVLESRWDLILHKLRSFGPRVEL